MKTTEEYINSLREYKQHHAEKYGIERIGIFGSVARGEHTEASDVDVFYEGPVIGLSDSVKMLEDLENLFGTRVDVIRKHKSLKPGFLQRIEKEIVYA